MPMEPSQLFGSDSSGSQAQAGFTPPSPQADPGGEQITPEQIRAFAASTHQQNEALKSELDGLKKSGGESAEMINKMRQIFNATEADPNKTAEQQDEDMLDYVLEAAMKSKEAGTGGMPITVHLAGQLVQMRKQFREQQSVLNNMKAQSDIRNDPRYEAENRAYLNMDTITNTMLENMYGGSQPELFQAAISKMKPAIMQIKRENPEAWTKLCRNPQAQQRFVQHYVEQIVPPKARDLLRHNTVMNTEQSTAELWQAFREAKAAYVDNPEEGRRVRAAIREQIMSQEYANSAGRARR